MILACTTRGSQRNTRGPVPPHSASNCLKFRFSVAAVPLFSTSLSILPSLAHSRAFSALLDNQLEGGRRLNERKKVKWMSRGSLITHIPSFVKCHAEWRQSKTIASMLATDSHVQYRCANFFELLNMDVDQGAPGIFLPLLLWPWSTFFSCCPKRRRAFERFLFCCVCAPECRIMRPMNYGKMSSIRGSPKALIQTRRSKSPMSGKKSKCNGNKQKKKNNNNNSKL